MERRETKQIIPFINNNGNTKANKIDWRGDTFGASERTVVKMLLNKSEDLTVVCLDGHTHTHTHARHRHTKG